MRSRFRIRIAQHRLDALSSGVGCGSIPKILSSVAETLMHESHCTRRAFLTATPALLTVPALLETAAWGQPVPEAAATGRQGTVVSVSPDASAVGLDMLKRGGTAVDAAVATALALTVTYPPAGNIGGGGFMTIAPPGQPPVVIDYRETAPGAAAPLMFAKTDTALGHKAVGVPGTVRGLELAHARFGKLPWKDLVEPAVHLANDGFVLDARLARNLNELRKTSPQFAELQRVFSPPNGGDWQPGERLVQTDLAKTLRHLADEGPDSFYKGSIARALVAEMTAAGGLITLADLADYRAKLREPIHGRYRSYDIYAPPPPSSGGICLVEMLNILAQFDLRTPGRWSAATLHLIAEAMRRAYCDRARHLGDPDFVEIPAHLTSLDHARAWATTIDPLKATPSESLARDIPLVPESDSTTHFSVIDRTGLAVSNTYTLEESFGSRVVVRGAGFLLNNEMGDFNWFPGATNRKGRIGTAPNQIAPGKRMLSSMCPTVVLREGRPLLITGSPGGRTIINSVICVLLNVLEFEMPLSEAVAAPRLHHQWFPDVIRFEGLARYPEAAAELQQKGHRLEAGTWGDAHSIRIDPGTGLYEGVADRRINGQALGY